MFNEIFGNGNNINAVDSVIDRVLVAISIKQAICIKQACIYSRSRQIHLNVPVLNKHLS